jgi:predicted Rossmann-fold nucleotide-binding protein
MEGEKMTKIDLPYQPIRQSLYTPAELFEGFDPADPSSFSNTADFSIYRQFIQDGGTRPINPYQGMMRSLHDCTITEALDELTAHHKVCAIMGDHSLARNSAAYLAIARLAQTLAANGFMVCTGGGPGAMEAGHLGAAFGPQDQAALVSAIRSMESQPKVPELKEIVTPEGKINEALVSLAHAWFSPAYQIYRQLQNPGKSLAVPTWLYGSEPTTPFATSIVKYFQNSIREDGLVSVADQGIVFSQGRAGTIQEVFQDATQNYYRTFNRVSPMVLFGSAYWTETFPIKLVLDKMFAGFPEQVVHITDDSDEAVAFLMNFNQKKAAIGDVYFYGGARDQE